MSLSFSVVICAYTEARWPRLLGAVASARAQTLEPAEIIVCIDHNPELAERCREAWRESAGGVRVIENRHFGRLGSARNTALEIARGDAVAFLDDDACAGPDWLLRLAELYNREPHVQAIGCSPRPRFERDRPTWFPDEFDWVFGCAYRGLPTEREPVGRLIGAAMSVRTAAALAVRGFHSDDHDDMDLSHRLIHHYGPESVVYDPSIQVAHHVTAQRLTWSYFWRRCFTVNRGKVLAYRDMEEAGNLNADVAFGWSILRNAVPRYVLAAGERRPLCAVASVAGLLLAGLGHLVGRISLRLGVTGPAATRGLGPPPQAAAADPASAPVCPE
ncbi:MAG: glycosyltransferase family 2 protein [Solirubrobacterales bacterium]|nr:glycosyltransferase family 2 protein [Solirubrobacterales bacterium]